MLDMSVLKQEQRFVLKRGPHKSRSASFRLSCSQSYSCRLGYITLVLSLTFFFTLEFTTSLVV